jgi:hypothetical protein
MSELRNSLDDLDIDQEQDNVPFGGSADAEVQKKGDTRIPNLVIEHPAFSDLNSYAFHALFLLHHRHRHPSVDKRGNQWGGTNGKIAYSREQLAKDMGVARRTATKALKALENGNFIKEVEPAKFNGQEWTVPEWRINYLPCVVTGKAPSYAFKRCKPVVSRQNPA